MQNICKRLECETPGNKFPQHIQQQSHTCTHSMHRAWRSSRYKVDQQTKYEVCKNAGQSIATSFIFE